MASFRFLHAADLHLDAPFEGLGTLQPALARKLKEASLDALDLLVEAALRERVAFVLLAGDLYDGKDRGYRAQLHFRKAVERLSARGIPTFIVHGNHDPVEEGWTAIREWPPGVTVFPCGQVTCVPVTLEGATLAAVSGISYATRETQENLARLFRRRHSGVLEIGLLHTSLDSGSQGATYAPCTIEDLKAAGLDYWALGHQHLAQVVRDEFPAVVYPGNTQGRSFKPAEQGAKGAVIVEVVEGRPGPPRFVPTDGWRFQEIQLSVEELPDLPALQRALAGESSGAVLNAAGRGLILRARLSGKSHLQRDLQRPSAKEALLEGLRQEAGEGLWWDSLRSAVTLPFDREALRERQDFVALLLQSARTLLSEPEASAALPSGFLPSAPASLAEIRHILATSGAPFDPASVVARAEDLALDLLLSGQEEP